MMLQIGKHSSFIDNDTGANWENLVSGLKQIEMGVVAESVESAFVPTVEVISFSIPLSPATPSTVQPISTPAQSEAAPVAPTPAAVQPLNPAIISSQVSARVAEVKAAIEKFEDTFSELMSDTRSSMSDRESQDRKFLDKFHDHLLVLPVSMRAIHIKFFAIVRMISSKPRIFERSLPFSAVIVTTATMR